MTPPSDTWDQEELFFDHASYFDCIRQSIAQATQQVDLEMYIFEPTGLGHQILQDLAAASQRGVQVRILIDGIGSPNWSTSLLKDLAAQQIEVRVFHPIRRAFQMLLTLRWLGAISRLNRRDHRKMVLVDRQMAFVGSMNIALQHVDWRETGVRVKGSGLTTLETSFERIWSRSWAPGQPKHRLQRLQSWLKRPRPPSSDLVKTNHSRGLRRAFNRERIGRIESAKQRVWMTSAYFVPAPPLLWALLNAAKQGCDVQLLLPRKSDVPIVKWLGELYYHTLLTVGIQIHEYTPSMMHAKSLMIDDWFILGTCNLNHRSLYRDLELDVVMTQPETQQALEQRFHQDLQQSKTITLNDLSQRAWIHRIGGRVAWMLKSWM